ncbi:MAG: YraN family protein [Acidobacteriaceae bacterium]|nr:YraN family protein [Acidobacteriaceae bacterium]
MTMGASAEIDTASPQTLRSRWFGWQSRVYRRLLLRAQGRRQRWRAENARKPLPEHLLTGEEGEDLAFFFLRGLGLEVVARRWRHPAYRGDLDLVAWQGETLVLAEVKTRTARDAYAAEEAVDADKRKQLRLQARAYLKRIPEPFRSHIAVRFDVLAVYLLPGCEPAIEHFPDAFSFRAAEEDEAPRFFRR